MGFNSPAPTKVSLGEVSLTMGVRKENEHVYMSHLRKYPHRI